MALVSNLSLELTRERKPLEMKIEGFSDPLLKHPEVQSLDRDARAYARKYKSNDRYRENGREI